MDQRTFSLQQCLQHERRGRGGGRGGNERENCWVRQGVGNGGKFWRGGGGGQGRGGSITIILGDSELSL